MKVCRVKGAASTFVIKKWVKKLPLLNSLLKIDSYPLFFGMSNIAYISTHLLNFNREIGKFIDKK